MLNARLTTGRPGGTGSGEAQKTLYCFLNESMNFEQPIIQVIPAFSVHAIAQYSVTLETSRMTPVRIGATSRRAE